MRIGELAHRSGFATSALRYYEQLGLLPVPQRTASGYRSYADDALDRLAFIRSAQAVGLTLAEVRQVLGIRDAGEAPCRAVTEMIDRRHAEVRSRIAELRVLERDLARLHERAARLEPRDCEPSGVCHVIPRQDTARLEPIAITGAS
jgi:MerR family copper efflux transcriptional regulator